MKIQAVSRISENTRGRRPCEDYAIADPENGIFIVADGTKSHYEKGLAHAYEMAARQAHDFLKGHMHGGTNMRLLLKGMVREINNSIRDEYIRHLKGARDEKRTMTDFGATTLDASFIRGDALYSIRVGDGILRLVTCQGDIISPFTEDHCLDLLDRGKPDDALFQLYDQATYHLGKYASPVRYRSKDSLPS